jgi:hypothetical protein
VNATCSQCGKGYHANAEEAVRLCISCRPEARVHYCRGGLLYVSGCTDCLDKASRLSQAGPPPRP